MQLTVTIDVPKGKEHCLNDKDKERTGFDFKQLISKALTHKWFGCGHFAVDIVSIKRNVNI